MYPPPSSQNRRPSDPIGGMPQDKKYNGEPTKLEMGDGNTVREYVTINTGTAQDVGITRLGDDNWIMAYVHIAHDCQIGSHTVIRSEEHKSELQSLMRNSNAVFCLQNKQKNKTT